MEEVKVSERGSFRGKGGGWLLITDWKLGIVAAWGVYEKMTGVETGKIMQGSIFNHIKAGGMDPLQDFK